MSFSCNCFDNMNLWLWQEARNLQCFQWASPAVQTSLDRLGLSSWEMTTGRTSRRCGHSELSEMGLEYSRRSGASLSKETLHAEGTWVTLLLSPNLERWTGSYMHLKGLIPEPGMFTYAAETPASLWPGSLYTNSHLLLRWIIPWRSVNMSTMDSLLALLTALLCPKHRLIPLSTSLLCLSVEMEQVGKGKGSFSPYSQASCSPALLEHTQPVLRETQGRPGWILHCP